MSSGKRKRKKKEPPVQMRRRNLKMICLAAGCGLLLACAAAALLILRANQCLTVCTIDGHPVSQAELQYCYIEQIDSYRDKIARFNGEDGAGPDFSRPLSEQSCPLTYGISWHDYFIDAALRQIKVELAAMERAREEGFQDGGAVERAVELRLEAMEAIAEEAGLTMQQYLRQRYGARVTEEMVRELEARRVFSARCLAASGWERPVSEEEIESRFSEKRRWNMTASYLAVPLDCGVEKRESAAADMEGAAGMEDFVLRCAAYCKADPMERAVTHTDAAAGEMEDYMAAEWVLDETRQPGDTTVVDIYDEHTNQTSLTALYFLGAQRNSRETYTYQEILLTPETVKIGGEALLWGAKRADKIDVSSLDEDSFGTLALACSALTSAGRLGVQVSDAESLNGLPYAEWLADENRKPGDVGIFETEYGVYLIRAAGFGAPYWRSNIEIALRNEAESALTRELEASANVKNGMLYSWLTR